MPLLNDIETFKIEDEGLDEAARRQRLPRLYELRQKATLALEELRERGNVPLPSQAMQRLGDAVVALTLIEAKTPSVGYVDAEDPRFLTLRPIGDEAMPFDVDALIEEILGE
jgi:hypothetical protein